MRRSRVQKKAGCLWIATPKKHPNQRHLPALSNTDTQSQSWRTALLATEIGSESWVDSSTLKQNSTLHHTKSQIDLEVLQSPNTSNNVEQMSVSGVLLTQTPVFSKLIQTSTLQYMRNEYKVLTLVQGEMQKLKRIQLHFTHKEMPSFHSWLLRSQEHWFYRITNMFQTLTWCCIDLHTKKSHSVPWKENNTLHFLKHITGKTSLYVICEELKPATQSTKYNSKVMSSVIN